MKNNILMAALLTQASIGGFGMFDSIHGGLNVEVNRDIKFHKHGDPNSRMESTRKHHKKVKRNKRNRKNKRGY